jgi:hypothetical protein
MADTNTMTKTVGTIVFSGDMNPDPDGCEAALREAGYEVTRMPERFKKLMSVPGDEFLEAMKVGTTDAICAELNAIVEPFGADADDFGEFDPATHIPFQFLREQEKEAG